jgi:hypothetical protein
MKYYTIRQVMKNYDDTVVIDSIESTLFVNVTNPCIEEDQFGWRTYDEDLGSSWTASGSETGTQTSVKD